MCYTVRELGTWLRDNCIWCCIPHWYISDRTFDHNCMRETCKFAWNNKLRAIPTLISLLLWHKKCCAHRPICSVCLAKHYLDKLLMLTIWRNLHNGHNDHNDHWSCGCKKPCSVSDIKICFLCHCIQSINFITVTIDVDMKAESTHIFFKTG